MRSVSNTIPLVLMIDVGVAVEEISCKAVGLFAQFCFLHLLLSKGEEDRTVGKKKKQGTLLRAAINPSSTRI